MTASTSKNVCKFTKMLNAMFRANGHFVADHSVSIIVVVFIFTLICSIPLPFTRQQDDFLVGYTPTNARSLEEMHTYRKFSKGQYVETSVYAVAADGGNMARFNELNETVALIEHISTNFLVNNKSFYDICTHFCEVNEPLSIFRNGLAIHTSTAKSGAALNVDRVNLSYPIMTLLGREVDISYLFFGVEVYDSCNKPANALTNIKHAAMIHAMFVIDRPESWSMTDLRNWDKTVSNYLLYEYKSTYIIPRQYSFFLVEEEIARTANTLFPCVTFGFLIMVTFSIATVFISARYLNQWSVHKIYFAVFAAICPLLAASASLGVLFGFGFRFGSILLVTPLLVLVIGVDDAYIMINAWQKICEERRRHPRPGEEFRDRFAEVVMEVGPSILITSLTNALAFGGGIFTPTPEIQLFSAANALAMIFDYFYTVTLYFAIVAIGVKLESKAEVTTSKDTIERKKTSTVSLLSTFLTSYCEWLSSRFTSLTVISLMVVYWGTAIYGVLLVKPGLSTTKLFLADSPAAKANILISSYVETAYTTPFILVNDASNLTNATKVKRIKSMVADFEALPECNGPQFTKFWMRDYEKFIADSQVEVDENTNESEAESSALRPYETDSIRQFLAWPEEKHWGGFVNLHNKTGEVESFFLLVPYHGEKFKDWNRKLEVLKKWRAIIDNYSDLSVSLFDAEASFKDQIETLVPLTFQSSLCTIACMILVCYLFMQKISTVLIAALSIFSIFLGVAGFLSLWGVDLDPSSMAVSILSIGMSVDFPSHITYHYHRTESLTRSSSHRMADALGVIGYPLLQCCFANIFYVFSFAFVDCYIGKLIIKMILLVSIFGMFHALVVIPALLCAFAKKK